MTSINFLLINRLNHVTSLSTRTLCIICMHGIINTQNITTIPLTIYLQIDASLLSFILIKNEFEHLIC